LQIILFRNCCVSHKNYDDIQKIRIFAKLIFLLRIMKKMLQICLIFLLFAENVSAKNKIVASIPFEMVGSYIVLDTKINQSSKLKMILDTGLRCTIVTELFAEDSLNLNYDELRDLQGLGFGKSFFAYESSDNNIQVGKIILKNRPVYAFKEDVFNLSLQTGVKINGLVGVDFFRDYVVEIDYSSRRIRMYEPEVFVAPKGYGVMPMILQRQKMYIHLSVLETDSALQTIKMLIDTGAELTAWFETLTNKAVSIPEKSIRGRIGEGLSGEINGVFARVEQLCISNFCVKNPIVAFPDSTSIRQIVRTSDRDGTIGGQLLSRFNLIIDTRNRLFYFKPNSSFNKPFVYNIAGLEVAHGSGLLPHAEVITVWKDSPAERAGVQTGDIITEINYNKIFGLSISDIRHFFEVPSKIPLKLIIERNGSYKELLIDMKAKI